MNRLNILVTGVGAIVGYGIVQSLKMTGRNINVIGMDIYPDAYGQHICDDFVKAEYANSPTYATFLLGIIKKFDINLVFFGTEQEIYKVSDSLSDYPEFAKYCVLNTSEVIDLSRDKLSTHQFLNKHQIEAIPTRTDGSFFEIAKDFGVPFIFKLRNSYASKGVFQIYDELDFDYRRQKSPGNFITQKLVGDDDHEYTVAIFGMGKDGFGDPFIMRRKLSGEGATAKATVEHIPELEQLARKLGELLQPTGPTNFQFRLHDGKYYLLEINPRISSSTSIRAAFGYNEADMSIQYYLENNITFNYSLKEGSAIRFVSDKVLYEYSNHI